MDKLQLWILTTLAGAAFSVLVALVIKAYIWMDSVKDNHLTHIQAGVEKTAAAAILTNQQLAELAIREEERHTREKENFDDLKTLIRTHGL